MSGFFKSIFLRKNKNKIASRLFHFYKNENHDELREIIKVLGSSGNP